MSNFPKIIFIVFIILWIFLFSVTPNNFNWFLENIAVFVALPLVVLSYFKFRLSNSSYFFIFIFAVFHVLGAYNTYGASPWGDWLKVIFNLNRNHYDRIVHFLYGVFIVPVGLDLFKNYLPKNRWLATFFVFSVVVSVGALYEISEFLVGQIVDPKAGLNFLGFQGDIWDTQKDMSLQAIGSLIGLIFFYFAEKIKLKEIGKIL